MDQLNKALADVMKNGTYQTLSTKYFQSDIACR